MSHTPEARFHRTGSTDTQRLMVLPSEWGCARGVHGCAPTLTHGVGARTRDREHQVREWSGNMSARWLFGSMPGPFSRRDLRMPHPRDVPSCDGLISGWGSQSG